jgi:predicted Zn-dependent protease
VSRITPLLLAIALPWAAASSGQNLASSRVTQADVVELQWRAFREFSQNQRESGAAVDDAVRTLNVDRIFARLLPVAWKWFPASSALRWEVLLTDDEGVEARAYPSGQIVLSGPFLARFVTSDAELAFLLGHEMAHVLLEHGRRGYEAAVPLTRLSGAVDARLIDENLKTSLALYLQLHPLLRAQESEADRLGAEIAAAAGFDQSAGAELLQRMAADGDDPPSTHDSLVSRSAMLRPAMVRR